MANVIATSPRGITVTVELDEREVQIIQRALYRDDPTDRDLMAANVALHREFCSILDANGIAKVSLRNDD